MNPLDELHRSRLTKAIEADYRSLEWVRNLKRGLVESYAGSGYGKPRSPRKEKLVNLALQTVEANNIGLVAQRPRVLVSTHRPELKYFAKLFTVTLNDYIEEIGLEFTFGRCVMDAQFGMGILKLHLTESAMELDRWADPGLPYASNLPVDNFVFDTNAPCWESVRYAGDSYRMAYSDLDHPMFDPAAVQWLVASKRSEDDDRTSRLSRGNESSQDELEEMVDLTDIWFPREGRIYTFPLASRGQFQIKGPPVAAMDWEGGERGPYPILSFLDVPDNIIPTSMLASLAPGERLINNILRKQGRQADRHKEITTFPAGAEEDMRKIINTSDGGTANVNNPEQIKQLFYGGVDPRNQAFVGSMLQLHNAAAGNPAGKLGLGAQAPTASQEQIIQGRIGSKDASMQYKVLDFSCRTIRGLAQMMWNDKALYRQAQIPLDGSTYSINAAWMPGDREGSFKDYQFEVYSMAYQSPEERVAKVTQFVTQLYAPLAQMFREQGKTLDLEEFVDMYAEFENLPQLKDCIRSAGPVTPGSEMTQEGAGPPNTTRTYERRSVAAGPTPQNAANQEIQQWLSMDSGRTGAMRGNPA